MSKVKIEITDSPTMALWAAAEVVERTATLYEQKARRFDFRHLKAPDLVADAIAQCREQLAGRENERERDRILEAIDDSQYDGQGAELLDSLLTAAANLLCPHSHDDDLESANEAIYFCQWVAEQLDERANGNPEMLNSAQANMARMEWGFQEKEWIARKLTELRKVWKACGERAPWLLHEGKCPVDMTA